MDKKLVFLGPLYPKEREEEIRANSLTTISNAPNVFQWNLLSGLRECLGQKLTVVNVLPVGCWKSSYRRAFLTESDWQSCGIAGHEIGSMNFPVIKQLQRYVKTKKLLKRTADENTEILIYSAYMPFLKAVYHLPPKIKITAIITDLPEFYDLGRTSRVRQFLRKCQNKMVYKYLERVDRFVVLTKQMCKPLKVNNRPWICIEGVCSASGSEQLTAHTDGQIKAIFYSGTLHYQYGIKNLLDAFSAIENDDLELWICGGGEAESEIKKLAESDKRLKFYGFCTQTEVARLRAKSAVLVNPRPNEGEYTKYSFPSKTMEYMTSGKPVVMYKLDGIPDEYDKYLNYVDASVSHTSGLKSSIMYVIANYDAMRAKADAACKFILDNKSGTVQAKKVIRFLESNP